MKEYSVQKFDCFDIEYDDKFLVVKTEDIMFYFNVKNEKKKSKLKSCFIPITELLPGVEIIGSEL